MTTRMILLAAFLAMVLAQPCAGRAAESRDLVAGAKKEAKLVVYSSTDSASV